MSTILAPANPHRRRIPKVPPHTSLRNLRLALGLTLDEVCARITQASPELSLTRGALSAIESGTRGTSELMLVAIARAYRLDDDAITTAYTPRPRKPEVAD